jgi:hypothetical protein
MPAAPVIGQLKLRSLSEVLISGRGTLVLKPY